MFRCSYCGVRASVNPGFCSACLVGTFDDECEFPDPIRVRDPFLDEVIGGYRPCSVLLSGPPGSGKSTLAGQWAKKHPAALYVTTEEHAAPVERRLARLSGPFAPRVIAGQDAVGVVADARWRGAVVVDSIGGLGVTDFAQQLRDVQRLVSIARGKQLTLFLLAHVNRKGDVAGMRSVEHAVDAVIMLDPDAGTVATRKTRFGPLPSPMPYVVTARGVALGGSVGVAKTGPGWVRTLDVESRETTIAAARTGKTLWHNVPPDVVRRVLAALASSEFAVDDHLIIEATTPVDGRAGLAVAMAIASIATGKEPPRNVLAGEVMAVGHVIASRDPRVASYDGHLLEFLRENVGKPSVARRKRRRRIAA